MGLVRVQYILLTGCMQFLIASAYVCVCVRAQVSFNIQCVSTEQDCVVSPRGDGGLRRLSHGSKSSLLEQ